MSFNPSYKARLYPPGNNKKILFKLERMLPGSGKYVLVSKPDGTHHEEFIDRADAEAILAAINRGFAGTLGGYVPPLNAPVFTLFKAIPGTTLPVGLAKTEKDWMALTPLLVPGSVPQMTDYFRVMGNISE